MELFRVLNAKVIEPWRRARRRRRDLCKLRSLDDRLLADIGVRRSDVEAVLYGQMPVEQLRRRDGHPATSAARMATADPERRPVGKPDRDALDRAA
jgi:uncharacterized protein YjiS (DUF1127 family)